MAIYYMPDFEYTGNSKEAIEQYLINHYAGNTDFDSEKEFEVIECEQFDEDCEPVGKYAELTVVIAPVMRWTAHDSERGEDYGVPTGRHTVYWS